MTMLVHSHGPFAGFPYPSGRRDTVGADAAQAHLAMIRRFCTCALTVLVAGGAVAAIIALKTAVYLSRLTF
jgi:hypothetical protein